MRTLKDTVRAMLPAWSLSLYHLSLAWLGALMCGRPSQRLLVIGVTGTKGKTTVIEMLNAILEKAGHTTALLNSIRIKLAGESEPNTGRSMPGRFFIQRLLDRAVQKNCTAAIIEMTSEGAAQNRHRFIELDALVFTNLAPEHIESHGSYEAYADAKFEIGKQLVRSKKRPRILAINTDDKESTRYLTLDVEHKLPFSPSACEPYAADENGGYFTFEDTHIAITLPGIFSLRNAIAAATVARGLGIRVETIARGLGSVARVAGRAERIEEGQDFLVVVDYAHTPDSLRALYEAYGNRRKICVVSATGGGRDTWKRPVMGSIAEKYCSHIIVTNEDPYDEDPLQIMNDVAHGMSKKPEIIEDRREAIRYALANAKRDDVVLISGKGTDAYIYGAHGQKTPWSDTQVVREELQAHLKERGV